MPRDDRLAALYVLAIFTVREGELFALTWATST